MWEVGGLWALTLQGRWLAVPVQVTAMPYHVPCMCQTCSTLLRTLLQGSASVHHLTVPRAVHMRTLLPVLLPWINGCVPGCPVTGTLAFKMAEQRYLWSVLPCLMAWPTVAMPVGQAAGIQVSIAGGLPRPPACTSLAQHKPMHL